MQIEFPLEDPTESNILAGIVFRATVDGLPIQCLISQEVLVEYYAGARLGMWEAFRRNREDIRLVARTLLEEGTPRSEDLLFVLSADVARIIPRNSA